MIAEVSGLVKNYPSFRLSDVSFSLESGRITGFIGRNGAGKTTTIRSMLNLIHPDGGKISFFGMPVAGNETEIKKRIGYSTGTVSWYPRKKIKDIVTKIYGGAGVEIAPEAKKQIRMLKKYGYDKLPVCMAKTQYSFSDNAKLLGAPEGFTVSVRNIKVSAGARFIVALTGEIMTMPGLPKVPAAENIDIDENGVISGLF